MYESTTLDSPDTQETHEEAPPKTNILNASHRCDTCSAAAYVRVLLLKSDILPEGGYLQFCSHHFNRNELGLIPYMDGKPIDERHKLIQNKLVGTENS